MLTIRFYENGIQNKSLADLFPLKLKQHKMSTRKSEKYKVTHATKERLEKSSVFFAQKELKKLEIIK